LERSLVQCSETELDHYLFHIGIIFNNGAIFKMRISDYPKLKKANNKQLQQWKLIGGGIGIRWELLYHYLVQISPKDNLGLVM